MNIGLVPTTEADRAFFRHAHHVAYRRVIEAMFGWDEAYQDAAADADFNSRNPHIIRDGDVPVGVIGWQDKTDCLWFGPIFILPEHQNKGIGSYLVKQFIARAQARRLPLRLQTLRQNEGAKKLYEKTGFKVIGSDSIHWQMEYSSP